MSTLQFDMIPTESKIKPASVIAEQKYKFSRYQMIEFLTKQRTFMWETNTKPLEEFHLESSNLEFVQKIAKETPTQIICDTVYNVIWKTPRGRILLETNTAKTYFFSYRKAKPEYNLPAYVMIWEKVY